MKITLFQQDTRWADPAGNRLRAEAAFREAPESDLYLLPEMWSTGFTAHPEGMAEPEEDSSLKWMQSMANRLNAAVAGSLAIRTADGTCRNRFYFVKPGEAQAAYYDKHHLFTYSGEQLHYTAGTERVIVEWRGVRFLLQVCYDLRFPLFSRNHEDYDCALYVAAWPESRIAAWHTLLHARAIENQCYVAGVNRVGTDPFTSYCGGTLLIDAYGKDVATCPPHEESRVTAELDLSKLNHFRAKFPVLKDRDKISPSF